MGPGSRLTISTSAPERGVTPHCPYCSPQCAVTLTPREHGARGNDRQCPLVSGSCVTGAADIGASAATEEDGEVVVRLR